MIMNVKAFDSALGFVPEKATRPHGFFQAASQWFNSIREGIVLAGEYKELTARGMPSDQAARKVFEKIGK
jgi:hypothetical protein